MKEVDVRLGNFEVHLFDASIKPRAVDPHHALNIPWQEQEKALSGLKQIGANIEKIRPHRDGVSYSINVFDPDGNRWELSFAKGIKNPNTFKFKPFKTFKHVNIGTTGTIGRLEY